MKVRWEEMFPDELIEAIERHPVCYAAYGLAEPHGAYNALGLDWLKAYSLVERAAKEHGGIVAPPFAWHVHERPFFNWLGENGVEQSLCSAVPEDIFLQMVLYQIRSLDARGFHVGILVTGHYGGIEDDMKLLCDYYTRRTGSPIKLQAMADWEVIDYPGYGGDHGGITETSQLMALHPELVELDRGEKDSPNGPWVGTEFPLADGRMPSKEIGEGIISSQVRNLGRIANELLESYVPEFDWNPPSLYDTADIWNRFAYLTRKYWWSSLTLEQNHKRELIPFPGWEALGE